MPRTPDPLLPGTLDLLILKAVSLGERHGYGVLLRLQQMTGGHLALEQGAIYPALYRLERQDLVEGTWGTSDNNRRAKFYRLTASGRRRLRSEEEGWQRMVHVIGTALKHRPGEA
jgi:transcriptional regulator